MKSCPSSSNIGTQTPVLGLHCLQYVTFKVVMLLCIKLKKYKKASKEGILDC